jgi:hypothetical protein
MARAVSICTEVNQHQRVLFKIREKANGGLTLLLRHGEHFRSYDKPMELGARTSVQRLSIQATGSSSDGNLIHQTLTTDSGTIDKYYWTEAIKQKQGFSLLFSKLNPTLDHDRYKLKENHKTEIVSVGHYDPKMFVLCYAVLVSAPEREFSTYYAGWFRYAQVQFRNFRVVVLISFLSLPSDSFGDLIHSQSSRDDAKENEELALHLKEFQRGHDEAWCADHFSYHLRLLLAKLKERHPEMTPQMLTLGEFFAHASTETAEYRAHGLRYYLGFLLNAHS